MILATPRLRSFLGILGCCIALQAHAQDTIRITLPGAEDTFLKKNLSLIAERYNIDIARALVLQAKLYNNPNFQVTGALYNPEQKKLFDVSSQTGEYIVGIQQLIILANKRSKQVRLAETNTNLAEYNFYELLRNLRFTLHADFYQAYFLQNSISAYEVQIGSLEKLATTYDELQKKDVVTLKDAVRIKSLLYSLKAERASLQNQFNDVEADLQDLLQNNHKWYLPVADTSVVNSHASITQFSLQTLVDSAYANRYDLKLAAKNLEYSQQNYSLQKALAVPDLILGAQFDKRGSFVENASFLNLSMDLPFFNRNQGNIKAAKSSIDQNKTLLGKQALTIENEVQNAYAKALNTEKMLASVDPAFRGQFEQLLKSVTGNFQRKNISLLDFTDFYDSYKENILQLNQLQNDRMQAIENLNYTIGKPIVNY